MNAFNCLTHKADSYRLGMHKSNLLLVERNNEVEINLAYSSRTLGEKQYELTNHLGNVLAVVTDKKLADNEPDVVSTSDYFPYGMAMPGRSAMSEEYRYGFTGHEKENEIAEGIFSTEYRLYDSRLVIWRSIDPLFGMYPGWSSYNYCANNPVRFIDPTGLGYELNNETGEYWYNENLTSQEQAAEGFTYLGENMLSGVEVIAEAGDAESSSWFSRKYGEWRPGKMTSNDPEDVERDKRQHIKTSNQSEGDNLEGFIQLMQIMNDWFKKETFVVPPTPTTQTEKKDKYVVSHPQSGNVVSGGESNFPRTFKDSLINVDGFVVDKETGDTIWKIRPE
jgi:RHS repeat-associated protein